MKRLLLLIVVVLLAGTLTAQNWEVVRSGNMEYKPNDGFFITPDSGWFVGTGGVVVRTTDGGIVGETVREPVDGSASWKDVEFANHLVGYACAEDGFIYKTIDAGLTWVNVGDTANYTSDLLHISVVNENVVYVAGKSHTLLKTINGGANWTKSTFDFNSQDLDGGIDFCSENVGVVAVDYSKHAYTWYTTDGGDTWTENEIFFSIGNSARIYDVAAGGDSTVVAAGYFYSVFVSQDGGKTYTNSTNNNGEYLHFASVDVVDKDVFVAGGRKGHVIITTNGGADWSDIDIPSGQTVEFVDFIDALNGYVFAGYGQWFKTADGGASWTPILDWPNVGIKGLAAKDNKVLVTGWGGEQGMTNDYGWSWTYFDNHLTGALDKMYAPAFYDADNGLLGGSNGELYRTTDGGQTWASLNDTSINPMFKIDKAIYAVRYLDANTVLAGGSSGHIMKSTDGGATWTELVNNAGNTIYDIFAVSSKQVLLGCSSGKIAVSNASIDTFNLAKDYGSMNMRGIDFKGNNGVIVGTKGYIYHTTVADWDTLTEVYKDGAGDDILGVAFITDNLVYAVGEKGRIFYSENAGLTWQEDVSPTEQDLERAAFSNNRLWAAGDDGVVIMKNFTPPAPRTGLVINEFMASNDAAFADEHGDFDDWIEIYNANDHAVDIGGMYVTDDLLHPTMWQIPDTEPDSTTIGPGGFLVLWADKESEEGVLHLEIKLSGKGEQIGLSDRFEGNTVSIDSLTFGPQWADTSYGYVEDGGGDRGYFNPSTPGESNANGIVVVGIEETPNPAIIDYHLAQNYPNPFNPTTKIEFTVPKAGKATLTVYSVTGQKVAVLLNKDVQAGSVSVEWEAGNMASGVYFYELKSAHFTAVKKMLLMK